MGENFVRIISVLLIIISFLLGGLVQYILVHTNKRLDVTHKYILIHHSIFTVACDANGDPALVTSK